ncbi:MAG: hypothetical protein JNK04_02085 [Myxococcales bacterium]|nr:hypothetical protein [Myxococcales bacterium]
MRLLFSTVAFAALVAHLPRAAFAQGAGDPPATPPSGQPPVGQPPTGGAPPTFAPSQPGQPDPWGGISSGGVAPPPPLGSQKPPTDPPPSTIDDDLDESKEKDSGRGPSWFWIEAQGGYEHVGLHTFNVDETALTAGLVETESNGGVISAGLGAQIFFLTIGARGRMGFFEAWQIGRIGGELGIRIPIGFVEPRFDLGAGYAALGSFDGVVAETVDIRGFYARAGAGVDFFPVNVLSIGAQATFDFMGLTRPGLDPTQIQAIADSPDTKDLSAAERQALALEGSGYGASFAIQGTIGLHF